MEKIDFINYQQPALNATNLNKLQQNVEDAIQEVQDVADDLDTNKLDKTSVKDTYSTSATDTYSCNYVNGLETYSADETRVGTWIDGKPIYRKVLNLTTPNNASETNIATLTGIDNLTDIKGFVINEANARVNYPYYFNSGNYGVLFYRTNTGDIVCSNTYSSYQNRPIIVIIEYTKTSD